jgi:hypothetical protein
VYIPPSPANVGDLRTRITELHKTVQYIRDFIYSVTVRRVKIFLLVHVPKLLMLFLRILTCYVPKVPLVVISYNGLYLLSKYLLYSALIYVYILFDTNVFIFRSNGIM